MIELSFARGRGARDRKKKGSKKKKKPKKKCKCRARTAIFLGEVKNPGLLHAGHTHTCAAWGVGKKRQAGQRVGRRGKNDGWGNGARSMAPGLGFSAGTHIQSIVSEFIVGKISSGAIMSCYISWKCSSVRW